MNIYVREIGSGELNSLSNDSRLVVEDNIGESIHIHIRNTRIEFSIDDYLSFADSVEKAEESLNDGNY